ncbi:MAG: LLM class flavin-dependent oxidoreductase [Alphaproteobacteria bacterium]|nr:LLM class flavin-dependent oxidoreductase [Alphaproteobacteria bacterium]
MRFGLFNLSPARRTDASVPVVIRGVLDQVRLAEALGFDIAWFAEHHFANLSISPSPLMAAAWCGAKTERIRVGPGVVVLPLYQPMRLVEEIAYADILTEGRLVLGVGSGSHHHEFRGFAMDVKTAHGRFEEAMDILEMAFDRGEVAYAGKHFQVPPTTLSLRPVQRPSPPIYVAGLARDAAVARRIGARGYTPFASAQWLPTAAVAATRKLYEAGYGLAGRDPASMPYAIQRLIFLTDSKHEAWEVAEQARYTYRVVTALKAGTGQFDGCRVGEVPQAGEQTIEAILAHAMIGDAERVAAMLAQDIEQVRPSHISLFMQFGDLSSARVLRSLETFGRQVLPLLERRFGPLDRLHPAALAAV